MKTDFENGAAAFGTAVSNTVPQAGGEYPVSRDPEQPTKAPLFDTTGTYFLAPEEQLKARLLEYFNFQGNDGFPRLHEIEAKCSSPDMRVVFELTTLFKRAARLGDGKKTTFLQAMEYYLRQNPERTFQFLVLIGLIGSCKDYRVFANSQNTNLSDATVKFYLACLTESFGSDFEGICDSKAFTELKNLRGLFFKWMPINKGATKTTFYNKMVDLYYQYKHGRPLVKNKKSFAFACMEFRKFVTANRKTSEQVMSQKGGLKEIDGSKDGVTFLNTLPAGTRAKHSGYTKKKAPRALERNLPQSLEEWRRALVRGDPSAKVNTAKGTVSAISVLDSFMDQYVGYILGGGGYYGSSSQMPEMTPELEITFKEIIRNGQEITSTLDMIPLIDLSGSMTTYKAINLALILAMIFTMRGKGHPLDGIWMPFSDNAKIINMGHCSTPMEWLARFAFEVKRDRGLVGYSTNYELALTRLIQFSEQNRIPVPDIISVTDMRMNEWRSSSSGSVRYGYPYGYANGSSSEDDASSVFTVRTLKEITSYNRRMGFEKIPNTFVVNCSCRPGLVPMTHKFENGAYYSCGTKGTQVSVLQVVKAFSELKYDEVAGSMCTPTPWTTMLKSMINFNEKLMKEYEIDLLGDVVLLGEKWFE